MLLEDVAALEASLAEGGEAGPEPSGIAAFHELRTAYNEAVAARRLMLTGRGEELEGREGPSFAELWNQVGIGAHALLDGQIRDVRLAVWLTEALMQTDGFAGLAAGLRVTALTCDHFWDSGLHPLPEGDDQSGRIRPLEGLNGAAKESAFVSALRLVPLVRGPSPDEYGLGHYLTAQHQSDDALQPIRDAALSAGADYLRARAAELDACNAALSALQTTVQARCGNQAPSLRRIGEVLDDAGRALRVLGGGLLEQPAAEEVSGASDKAAATGAHASGESTATAGPAASGTGTGPIRNRAQALRQLGAIAEYFRSAEPHSPLYHCITQVVRWGEMEYPQLIQELVSDDSERRNLFRLTGVRESEDH